MSDLRVLQTLRYQALERAIGELKAARQATYPNYPERGAEKIPDPLDDIIDECIVKIRDNM